MTSTRLPKVTIYHFDDEPEKIESLRNNLLALILARHPEWIHTLPTLTKDAEDYWTMKVHHPGGVTELSYVIYRSSQRFIKECEAAAMDIVILDAYEIDPDTGGTNYVAKDCVTKVMELAKVGRVLVFSAYLSTLPPDLQMIIPERNLIPRPFNVNEVAEKLLGMAGIAVSTERDQ